MIDFASVDFLPYHVFPTTLDANNFGTGWIHVLRNGKQWHFIFSAPSRAAMKISKISFHVHLTDDICQHGLRHINRIVILNIRIFVLII